MTCGKLMFYYQITMKILSIIQFLLFDMEKCYVRVGFFYFWEVFLCLFFFNQYKNASTLSKSAVINGIS